MHPLLREKGHRGEVKRVQRTHQHGKGLGCTPNDGLDQLDEQDAPKDLAGQIFISDSMPARVQSTKGLVDEEARRNELRVPSAP